MPDDFSVKEMKFEGDRLSLVDTEGEKIEATLKQFNKALQNIWRNFTMEELSGAFRSAPDTVLEEITKEKMPKTVTIKNFGKFTNKEELNIYKLVKEGIEYYFNAENKNQMRACVAFGGLIYLNTQHPSKAPHTLQDNTLHLSANTTG